MNPIDPFGRSTQEVFLTSAELAAPNTAKVLEQIEAATSATPMDLEIAATLANTDALSPLPERLAPQPQPEQTHVELDPIYLQKREDALRTTGRVLNQHCVEKMERLRQLKHDYTEKLPTPPTEKGAPTLQDQQLAILRLEEARLQAEYDKIQSNREVYPEVLQEVSKLRVRQMLQDSIRDYGIMTPHLQQELDDSKAELVSEKRLLKELKTINKALQARREDLQRLVESGMSEESRQGQAKMQEIRDAAKELTKELAKFLKKHHPPIQPEEDDQSEFDLKHVLEDIMNLSVSQPADPYVVLVPGEYYSPHVEQLINAGIAVRHPRDSQKLRLVDFYS